MKLTLTKHAIILNALLLISLVVITQLAIFGQSVPIKSDQIRLEVAEQSGSPVQLTAIGVRDNPNFEDVQVVEFTIQNISQKKIIAFTPFLSSPSYVNGSTIENRYDLEPGKIISTALQEDRTKLRSGERFMLSMDYVLFSDGTWWGSDSQKQSEYMAGYYEGEKAALDQVKVFIKANNKKELFDLLRLEQNGNINEHTRPVDKEKTEKWRRGFLSGFRVALVGLLPMDRQQGKYIPITDDMKLDDFLPRLKNVELTRSKYLDNPK